MSVYPTVSVNAPATTGPIVKPSDDATSTIENTRDSPPPGPKMPGRFSW